MVVVRPHRYDKAVIEERELSPEARVVASAGKMDAKKHLAAEVSETEPYGGRNMASRMGKGDGDLAAPARALTAQCKSASRACCACLTGMRVCACVRLGYLHVWHGTQVGAIMASNIAQSMGTMLDTVVF
jgi:hypothetical protein